MSLTFRPGCVSDLPRVEDICRPVFSGTDYAPVLYTGWVEGSLEGRSSASRLICGDREGVLVGFVHVRLVDRGTTAWLEGLRVGEDCRGCGYGQLLFNEAVRVGLEVLGAARARYSTMSENKASIHMGRAAGMRVSEQLLFVRLEPYTELPGLLLEPPPSPSSASSLTVLEDVGMPRLRELLARADPATRRELLPHNMFNYNWKFYEGDIPEEEDGDVVVVAETDAARGALVSFSVAHYSLAARGDSNWSLSVHTESRASMARHLRLHAPLAAARGCRDMSIFCSFAFREWFVSTGAMSLALGWFTDVHMVVLEITAAEAAAAHRAI